VTAPAVVVPLERARAESLTAKLRDLLDLAVDVVRELHEREGWRAMGYTSWPDYCRAELPQLAVIVRGMPKPERRAKVAELRAGGMSLRDVSEVTGLAPNTVRADAAAAGVALEVVRGRDGAERAASRAPVTPAPRVPIVDRVVALVAGAGQDGATLPELLARTRIRREQLAPALCRLSAGPSPRLVYLRPAKRGQLGRYAVRP
jgi:hypothetical protein